MGGHLSKAEKSEHERWEAESDLRALVEVGRIRADKPRLGRAMAMAKKQLAELKKVKRG